ncbi:MAG: hypothetical protein ABI723_12965 [Bacteroidia bacterium]
MQKTLDKVIIEVLKSSPKPLSVKQIADIISKEKLWFRPKDNQLPNATQVSARVNNYSNVFKRRNGVVTLKSERESDNRLCKIVWNSNYWIKPMERSWNPSYIEDPNKGYEQKHGFVHEDWLFNPKFIFDGYHYGYIRGIGKLNSSIKTVDKVYLFTINPNSKERFYVGKLHEVESMQYNEINKHVLNTIHSYEKDMIQELKDTGADFSVFKKDPFVPNLRFKVESKELFPTPLIINSSWFISKYFRTMPMKMDAELYYLLHELEKQIQFTFVASSPESKKGGYTKHTKEGTTQVDKVHDAIEKALYNYLLMSGVSKSQIACDTTSFGGKLADVVINFGNNKFDIYEIKTDTDIRRGLREAIGQLLDYATWEKAVIVKNIHAVLPYCPLSKNIKDFIQRLKENLNLKFEVLFYNKDTKTFSSIV